MYIMLYLILINLTGFILMFADKRKAENGAWRIPEKMLFLVAIIGGSIGSILGMYTFRHKTKHMSFDIGMPLIFVVQIILTIVFIRF